MKPGHTEHLRVKFTLTGTDGIPALSWLCFRHAMEWMEHTRQASILVEIVDEEGPVACPQCPQ